MQARRGVEPSVDVENLFRHVEKSVMGMLSFDVFPRLMSSRLFERLELAFRRRQP